MMNELQGWCADDPMLRIHKPAGHLSYQEGWLFNVGDEVAAQCEIVEPFYKYLGDVPPGGKVNVSEQHVRFVVQCLTPAGLAKWRAIKQTFAPPTGLELPEIGLDVRCALKGLTLIARVHAQQPITNVALEVLPDIPVRIANERIRYIQSSVGVAGQNVIFSDHATFPLLLLQDRPSYTVPVRVSFDYSGIRYDKLVLFSFAKEELR